ncbi:MAG: tetratricopeptide repeat protein [Acidobacteriaceae bacterium]|nr:tetratricopeptide repeat protein [Acidobacteriaceae bacterium]
MRLIPRSRPLFDFVLAAIIVGAAHGVLAAQSRDQAGQQSTGSVRATYNFRFGPDQPSTPGNAMSESHDFMQPGAFPSAAYCGHCHPQAYAEWRQALHSNSFRTPFYRTSVNILARTKGIEFTRHCDSCHNPIGVLSGALTQNSKIDRSFDQDGLTCMTCHSITSLQPIKGNGSFVMGSPTVMLDENGKPIQGVVPDADILAHPERHSRAVMRDFLRKPEFCAACHKANLPEPLNDYKFIRAFTVYDEWQNSKFSKRNPLTFYQADFTTCQKCHMMREPARSDEYGAKQGTFATHRWPAGNTAVPFYYGFDDQLNKTTEFLKSGMYLNVDLFAIKNEATAKMAAPLGSVPAELSPNEIVEAMVVIQNKNIGHSLIPEVRDLYEAWVEFEVKDASGKEIYHSGFLKADGSLDERAHSFTNRPVNMDGDFVDNHKVWTIHSVAYDNTIQSGRSALVRYEFRMPADVQGPVSLTAKVNYRHLRQSYLNNVFGPNHPAYPVIQLASRTRTFNLGENAAGGAEPHDNPDWMRWNNLGIAYLDQLQYADSLTAFEQVIKLRPDYADGFINIGLTNIEWEKYSAARASLQKALVLSPNNARALYYLALVERREGRSEQELADLESVVEQYPQSRDARRELGISYYQRHRYDDARQQFEALQTTDPDDLAAHYNLAVLYRRMGLKQKAAEQAALFATKQVDPGAPTYSLDFLRKHPEISIESVPWHMHKDPALGVESAHNQ